MPLTCGIAGFQAGISGTEGAFQGSTDVGGAQGGSTAFDATTHSYRIGGSGEDIWGTADAFRLNWTRLSGDATLSADVHVMQPSTHPLAKAVLMFRQSLDPGSPYADIAIHADGHITLQYRELPGGVTKDTVLRERDAERLRIERRGDQYTAYAVSANGKLGSSASITIPLTDPLYVGVGVCAHKAGALQAVTFSNITLDSPKPVGQRQQ